jgi:hypothetical protein
VLVHKIVDRLLTAPAPTFVKRGFPHGAFPRRWFQVGWSHEFAPGDVAAMGYFGADRCGIEPRPASTSLVAWRFSTRTARTCRALLSSEGEVDAAEPDDLAKSIATASTAESYSRTTGSRRWENQRYRPHPILAGYEATHTHKFRDWSQRFDPATSPTAGAKPREVGVLGGQSVLRS